MPVGIGIGGSYQGEHAELTGSAPVGTRSVVGSSDAAETSRWLVIKAIVPPRLIPETAPGRGAVVE